MPRRHRQRARLALLLGSAALAARAGTPVRYEIDPVHTRVVFDIDHAGFSRAIGTLSGSQGSLQFDADDWSTATLDVIVPMQRLDMGDSGWSAAVFAGAGYTPDEIGSPRWRIGAQLAFHQAPVHDLDGDGVLDRNDACWREREDHDGFQDWDGCPERDNDGDGVLDADDACPLEPEDHDGYRDSDGCPDDEQRTNATPAP